MVEAFAALPTATLFLLAGVAILLSAVLGIATNLILRDHGFGIIVNGFLMTVGFTVGICTRYALFGAL